MHHKRQIFKACIFLLFAVSLFAQTAYLRTTIGLPNATAKPYCIPWVDSGAKAATTWATTTSYTQIFPDTQYQTITGWGGAIQEKWWDAIQVLDSAGQDSVMRALFDTSGCNFNWCRVPIGCCDFDDSLPAPISEDSFTNDYSMTHFTIHRDSTKKIPMIHMAQAINPNAQFWGCPWSPPHWMHDNNQYSSGNMKSDSLTQAAWALYLAKWVQAYKACGINITSICCQNEPTINSGGYPKCGWVDTLERSFYHKYMIPLFKQDSLSTRIICGVFCCGNYSDWVTSIMSDTVVKDFVNVTSHSYQDPEWGPEAVAAYPSIQFVETEAPFGPGPPGTGLVQNWAAGLTEFQNISQFMNDSTSAYDMWDVVNDTTNFSGWGWEQYEMINVNQKSKNVTYNPHFYAMKHFSYYVKPGAKAIRFTNTGTAPANTNAFLNPNGDIILVMANTSTSAFPLTVKVGNNEMYKATLPPNSFNSLRIVNSTAVRHDMQLNNYAPSPLRNLGIRNSMLTFSLSSAINVREMDVTLTDLQGRAVWSGHRSGSALRGDKQTFVIRSEHGSLPSGTYLIEAKIRNVSGAVMTVENKVTALN
jgi:glucosylceramidase